MIPALRHLSENFDGSGFSDRLTGENIPLLSRIASVVLAYVEIGPSRGGAQGSGPKDGHAQLRARSGTKFDPKIVNALLESTAYTQIDSNPDHANEQPSLRLELSFTEQLDRAIRSPPAIIDLPKAISG